MISYQDYTIQDIPVTLYGDHAEQVFLYVHGLGGERKEAARFAALACPMGAQVLSVELPKHGERQNEPTPFTAWTVGEELQLVAKELRRYWSRIGCYAVSFGAYCVLTGLGEKRFLPLMLQSPMVDLADWIRVRMARYHITEADLRAQGSIDTPAGTLDFDTLSRAKAARVNCCSDVYILCAKDDAEIANDAVLAFAKRFDAKLTLLPDVEHWFHTPTQLAALTAWERGVLCATLQKGNPTKGESQCKSSY